MSWKTSTEEKLDNLEVVKSNRGIFLLADNYFQTPEDDNKQVKLIIGKEEFPFGGNSGAYQWKLNSGEAFSIRKDDQIFNFKLVDEVIVRINSF